jgi:hypothetical protein
MDFCARLIEMSEQKPGEPLREYLDRRETELQISINALHDQLRPQESELAEIRRAKGALGIPILHLVVSHSGASLEIVRAPDRPPLDSEQEALQVDAIVTVPPVTLTASAVTAGSPQISSPNLVQNNSEAAAAATTDMMVSRDTPLSLRMSAYQHLTMKQLVMKALNEHFQKGATARQLREFFRDAWGRPIKRANLSPQLSRLLKEGIIGMDNGVWSLMSDPATYSQSTIMATPVRRRQRRR